MPSFDLYLDLGSRFRTTEPTFEVLVDGVVVSNFIVGRGFTPLTLTLSYSGDRPDYLSFRFNDTNGEVNRSVIINEVRINSTPVAVGSISKGRLLQGQESQIDTAAEQVSFGIPGPSAGTDALINGTAAADTLTGTAGNDTINGLAGNDVLKGYGGIDTINGGDDHDVIRGGDGDDILNGDDGQDLIKGENDNDVLNGGLGHDTLDGGAGTDTLNGDDGNDVLKGGTGIDTLRGGNGNDKIFGGDDGDFIYGDADNDKLLGEGGNDSIYGGTGNDNLNGGLGDDLLDGEDGNDRAYGEDGVDTIYGRDGNDLLDGGAGNDTIFGGNDNDRIFGGDGDDILNGEAGNDRIVGGAGIDTINGGAGIDNIDGNDGNDILRGGGDNDLIKGGAGDDLINGDDGNDNLYGQEGNDTLNGGNGNDYMYGRQDNDRLNGGNGDDVLRGGEGNDDLRGDNGNDVINGEDGVDSLRGGNNDDVLIGGSGADTLRGDAGNDILHGHGVWHRDAWAIEAANPGVVYNEATNSFYQFVGSSVSWTAAQTAANASILNGVAGHLVNVTSEAEKDFIYNLGLANGAGAGNRIWLGANDVAVDQEWRWIDGIEAGLQFSQGSTATNNFYNNWGTGQPNNSGGSQVYGTFWYNGTDTWDDRNATDTHFYVIEWDAGMMNDDNAADVLRGGSGNDTLYGYGGNDDLRGEDNDDLLLGGDGNDTLDGGGGVDVLYGQEGNDILEGRAGNDTLYGGNGSDWADYRAAAGSATVNLATGTASDGDGGTDTLFSIENIDGSNSADNLTGDGNANIIDGNNGDDIIDGGAGDDTINGGNNNDSITGGEGADIMNGGGGSDSFFVSGTEGLGDAYNGNNGTDRVYLGADTNFNLATSFNSINSIETGGFNIIALVGGGFNLTGQTLNGGGELLGQTGNETITGSESADTIRGGDGIDTLNGGNGADSIYGDNGDDIINGGGGADNIYGGAGADIMNGGGGSDSFFVSGTDGIGDSYLGDGGTDRVYLGADTYFNLANAFASLNSIETGGFNIIADLGTGFDLTGQTLNGGGELLGQTGNENITGSNGADTIRGGDGLDTLNGGNGGDTIYGDNGDDTINGGGGGDFIYGGVGADILNGDGGNDDFFVTGTESLGDQYDGGNNTDEIYLLANSFFNLGNSFTSIETIQTGGFNLIADIGTGFDLTGVGALAGGGILLGQGGNEVITGSNGVDVIDGAAGNDTLNGANGNDDITGGAGVDIMNGGAGNDEFFFAGTDGIGDTINGGIGTDRIELTANAIFGSNTFTNMERIDANGFGIYVALNDSVDFTGMTMEDGNDIFGDTGSETITGSNSDDDIRGEDGADILNGGLGNDNFYIDGNEALGDTYDGGGGTDDELHLEGNVFMNTATSFVNVEQILFNGFNITVATGESVDFTGMTRGGVGGIYGQAGNETISGTEGEDNIYGGAGDDILNGNGGNDNFYVTGLEALNDTFDGGAGGDDEIWLQSNTTFGSATSFSNIEQVVFNGFDILIASGATVDFTGIDRSGAGDIIGDTGNETIRGMDNADFIYAGAGDDILFGGDGRDELYGEGGADTFVLENATAFNDVERIRDFSTTDNDALDISDLLTGYTFGVDTLTDFVQITDAGANSSVFVDTTGTGSFAGNQVATLFGITGLTDEVALETSGNLIT